MAPIIQEMEIQLFDLHLSLHPLTGTGVAPQSRFRFLLNRQAYSEAFEAAPIKSENFSIHALRRELKRNHFWKFFREIWVPTAGPSPEEKLWDLQVPFRCRPTTRTIDVDVGTTAVRCHTDAEVLLWPVGWSSNVKISVEGALGVHDVRQLVGVLLSGSPFRIDGQPVPLSRVFRELTDLLKEDVYGTRHGVGDKRKVDRHRTVAITRADAPLPPYDPNVMSDALRSAIVGTLRDEEITLPALSRIEAERKLLRVPLRGSDFGLMAMDHDSILLALTGAADAGRGRRSLHCLVSNIRVCTLMAEMLRLFRSEATEAYAAGDPKIRALDAAAGSSLRELPERYDNPFCRGLFRYHGGLPGPGC